MVSVIIPVYNRTKTIRVCVQSILDAGYEDLEIILVDDGSTDSSLAKCYDLAQEDSRVFVIHQENAGVSAARNKGIEAAHGEWITFVDSDDAVSTHHFDIVQIAENDNIDLVQVQHANGVCDGDSLVILDNDVNEIKNVRKYGNKQVLNFLFSDNDPYKNLFFFCHDKFFKKDVIDKFKIRFPIDVSLGEDQIFVCENLKHSNTLLYSSQHTSIRLQWAQEKRTYQLGTRRRSTEEYIDIIQKNYNAINQLYEYSGIVSVKSYALYYLFCRPLTFLVFKNFASWHCFRSNWREMKDDIGACMSIMRPEKSNIYLIRKWRVKILGKCLFRFGIDSYLGLAWCIRCFDYVLEGVRYRVRKIGLMS